MSLVNTNPTFIFILISECQSCLTSRSSDITSQILDMIILFCSFNGEKVYNFRGDRTLEDILEFVNKAKGYTFFSIYSQDHN